MRCACLSLALKPAPQQTNPWTNSRQRRTELRQHRNGSIRSATHTSVKMFRCCRLFNAIRPVPTGNKVINPSTLNRGQAACLPHASCDGVVLGGLLLLHSLHLLLLGGVLRVLRLGSVREAPAAAWGARQLPQQQFSGSNANRGAGAAGNDRRGQVKGPQGLYSVSNLRPMPHDVRKAASHARTAVPLHETRKGPPTEASLSFNSEIEGGGSVTPDRCPSPLLNLN